MTVTSDELWENRAQIFVAALIAPPAASELVVEKAETPLTDAERDLLWENRGAVMFPHPNPVRTALAELAHPDLRAAGGVSESSPTGRQQRRPVGESTRRTLRAMRAAERADRSGEHCKACKDGEHLSDALCPICGL